MSEVAPATVAAVVVAGGLGTRFAHSAGTAKQFLTLAGSPLYQWSFLAMACHPQISTVVLVVPADEVSRLQPEVAALAARPAVKAELKVAAGGASRQESVYMGLLSLSRRQGFPDFVLVHDAARPFLDSDTISRVIAKVIECGACTTGVPASDTIKKVRDDKIVGTLDRSEMLMAQTPQAARFADMLVAHEEARRLGNATTDDASLLEAIGVTVSVVEGSPYNIKVTKPLDLTVCEALSAELLKDRL